MALYAFLENSPADSTDLLGMWRILPFSGVVPVPHSHPYASALGSAFNGVRSQMPSLIARAGFWIGESHKLPDSCPWKARVLQELRDLRIRLVKMNQDLWDTARVLPVYVGSVPFVVRPLTNAFMLSRPAAWPFDFKLYMQPSFLSGGKPIALQALLFHELYHTTDWDRIDDGVVKASRWVDDAQMVDRIFSNPSFNVCGLVESVALGGYRGPGAQPPTGANGCCPRISDWCIAP